MDAEVTPPDERDSGPNPVLWVVIGLPTIAVCASLMLLFTAVRGAEPKLPAHLYLEGAPLEQDLHRAERAAALGAAVVLDFATPGQLRAELVFDVAAEALPERLELRLTHSTLPALDRTLSLLSGAAAGAYVAALPPLEDGRWLVEVADADHWRVRARFQSPVARLRLGH